MKIKVYLTRIFQSRFHKAIKYPCVGEEQRGAEEGLYFHQYIYILFHLASL